MKKALAIASIIMAMFLFVVIFAACERPTPTDPLGCTHTPGAAATCDTPQICTTCQEELVPAGHLYGNWTIRTTHPSMTASAAIRRFCTVHTTVFEDFTLPNFTDEGWAVTASTAATCTADGSGTVVWTMPSGQKFTYETHLPALGHDTDLPFCAPLDQTCKRCDVTVAKTSHVGNIPAATCKRAQECIHCETEMAPERTHEGLGNVTFGFVPYCECGQLLHVDLKMEDDALVNIHSGGGIVGMRFEGPDAQRLRGFFDRGDAGTGATSAVYMVATINGVPMRVFETWTSAPTEWVSLFFIEYRPADGGGNKHRITTGVVEEGGPTMLERLRAAAPIGKEATVIIEVYNRSTGVRLWYSDEFTINVAG